MNYTQALKECKRVGTDHAEGDALRAMYAKLITVQHGLIGPQRFYAYLTTVADAEIAHKARRLLRSSGRACVVGRRYNEKWAGMA